MAPRESLLLAALFFAGAIVGAQGVSFPGRELESKSPDGEYIIQNLDYGGTKPAHVLVLLDRKSGTKTKIHSYDRHVNLLWSPRSDAFVINDHEASDSTRPLLFLYPWTDGKIDLLKKLTEFMSGRHEEERFRRIDHVYFTVRRWINPDELLCELDAYGGGSQAKGSYIYKIRQGFRVYNPKVETK